MFFDTMAPTHVRHFSDIVTLLRKQRKIKYISRVDYKTTYPDFKS